MKRWYDKTATHEQNALNWIEMRKRIEISLDNPDRESTFKAMERCIPFLQSLSLTLNEKVARAYMLIQESREHKEALDAEIVYINVWKILQDRA